MVFSKTMHLIVSVAVELSNPKSGNSNESRRGGRGRAPHGNPFCLICLATPSVEFLYMATPPV